MAKKQKRLNSITYNTDMVDGTDIVAAYFVEECMCKVLLCVKNNINLPNKTDHKSWIYLSE